MCGGKKCCKLHCPIVPLGLQRYRFEEMHSTRTGTRLACQCYVSFLLIIFVSVIIDASPVLLTFDPISHPHCRTEESPSCCLHLWFLFTAHCLTGIVTPVLHHGRFFDAEFCFDHLWCAERHPAKCCCLKARCVKGDTTPAWGGNNSTNEMIKATQKG